MRGDYPPFALKKNYLFCIAYSVIIAAVFSLSLWNPLFESDFSTLIVAFLSITSNVTTLASNHGKIDREKALHFEFRLYSSVYDVCQDILTFILVDSNDVY